jgi:hypothetical protein
MRRISLLAFLIFLLVASAYIFWNYFKVYSDGYREGALIKFSRKGNVFKTYEGEMVQQGLRSTVPGSFNTNNFYFSVASQQIADSLEANIGKVVKLHYTQYLKTLPWRGDNYDTRNSESGQYIVDRIAEIKEAPATNNPPY